MVGYGFVDVYNMKFLLYVSRSPVQFLEQVISEMQFVGRGLLCKQPSAGSGVCEIILTIAPTQ